MRALRLGDWRCGPEFVTVEDPEPGSSEVRIGIGRAVVVPS